MRKGIDIMNKQFPMVIVAALVLASVPQSGSGGYALTSAREQISLQKIGAMMEISWVMGNINYTGLMVMKKEGNGVFVVKYMHPGRGIVRVRQDALLNNQYDMFGNCTSFIMCSNPQPSNLGYSADYFCIQPNGSIFTMDAQGNWSTMIMATPIMPQFWLNKLQQYGLDANLNDIDDRDIGRATPKYAMVPMIKLSRRDHSKSS